MITWTVCWGTRPILKRGRVTSTWGLCSGVELNKAAEYRPCLNWDSAKFQLPCNWRNLIMSRVEGPWGTIPASFRFKTTSACLHMVTGQGHSCSRKLYYLCSRLSMKLQFTVISFTETRQLSFLRWLHFYTNSYPVIQACHNLRNFQHWLKSYLYLLIIHIVKEQTGFRA